MANGLIQLSATDRARIQRQMRDLAGQAEFTMMLALNYTAEDSMESLRGHLKGVFDQPVPLTVRSVRVRKATKQRLEARLWFTDELSKGTPPAKYLRAEILGGERNQKRSERALMYAGLLPPTWLTAPGYDAPLDAFGNLSGAFVMSMLSQLKAAEHVSGYQANVTAASQRRIDRQRKKLDKQRWRFFVMRRGRRPLGVYVREGEGKASRLLTILRFHPTIKGYERRVEMADVVSKVVDRRFHVHIDNAIRRVTDAWRPK